VVRLPRDVTPGAGARRSLLVDSLIALLLAMVAILLAAGIGVVGFVALLVLLLLLLWIGIEAALHRHSRRRRVRGKQAMARHLS
jgi:NhaP-type Na+/H+ or K+/H+ antiporter